MIIKDKEPEIVIPVVWDIEPLLKENQRLKKEGGKGMSKGKTMRRIGSIPLLEFIRYPELAYDNNALKRFLKEHPEYRTSEGGI